MLALRWAAAWPALRSSEVDGKGGANRRLVSSAQIILVSPAGVSRPRLWPLRVPDMNGDLRLISKRKAGDGRAAELRPRLVVDLEVTVIARAVPINSHRQDFLPKLLSAPLIAVKVVATGGVSPGINKRRNKSARWAWMLGSLAMQGCTFGGG